MNMGRSYFEDKVAPKEPRHPFSAPESDAPTAPSADQIIASLAPRVLTSQEVHGLLRAAVGAARTLKSKIAQDGYQPIGRSLRVLMSTTAQTAGRAPTPNPLAPGQTSSVIGAVAQFWRAAHAAGIASQTTLDFRPTQTILARAKSRGLSGAGAAPSTAMTPPQGPDDVFRPAPDAPEVKKSWPGWVWALIGVGTAGVVGTVIYLVVRNKNKLPELYPGDEDAPEEEEADEKPARKKKAA